MLEPQKLLVFPSHLIVVGMVTRVGVQYRCPRAIFDFRNRASDICTTRGVPTGKTVFERESECVCVWRLVSIPRVWGLVVQGLVFLLHVFSRFSVYSGKLLE